MYFHLFAAIILSKESHFGSGSHHATKFSSVSPDNYLRAVGQIIIIVLGMNFSQVR